jgi:hypothetical protein
MVLEGGVALGLAATTAGCVLDIGLDIVIAELKCDTGAKGRVLVGSAGDEVCEGEDGGNSRIALRMIIRLDQQAETLKQKRKGGRREKDLGGKGWQVSRAAASFDKRRAANTPNHPIQELFLATREEWRQIAPRSSQATASQGQQRER